MSKDLQPDDLVKLAVAPEQWALSLIARHTAPQSDMVRFRTYLLMAGCVRRYRAGVHLLSGRFVEESMVVGRSLQEDAARLRFLAGKAPEQRMGYLLGLWNDLRVRRRKMVDGLARDPALSPAQLIVADSQREAENEERAFTKAQESWGHPIKRVPKDADLVSPLGPMERMNWGSASISSHTTWNPGYQDLHLDRSESGRIEVLLWPKDALRNSAIMLHELGRWLFFAADAFEIIFEVETPEAEDRFTQWHAAVEETVGVKSIEELLAERAAKRARRTLDGE
jgi:hypothetical protein